MKRVRVGGVVASCILAFATTGRTAGRVNESVDARILKYCDPVCELQGQDAAFSLLVESYRQFQSYQIRSDYERRLKAADRVSDDAGSLIISDKSNSGLKTLRQFVLALARKEYDLRMEKLQTEVENFRTAYNCARHADEERVGERVPNRVDTTRAANRLHTLGIVALGTPARADFVKARAISAEAILYDAPQYPVAPEDIIENCE